jgi:hypothetical protein
MEVVIAGFDAEGCVVCNEEKGEKNGASGMAGSHSVVKPSQAKIGLHCSNQHTCQFNAYRYGTYPIVACFREIRSILAWNMIVA